VVLSVVEAERVVHGTDEMYKSVGAGSGVERVVESEVFLNLAWSG
jgi:hypothetical protein